MTEVVSGGGSGSSLDGKVGEKANELKDAGGKGVNKGIEAIKLKKAADKEVIRLIISDYPV